MKGIVRRRDRARQDLIAIYRHLAREAGVRTASRFHCTGYQKSECGRSEASATRHTPWDPF